MGHHRIFIGQKGVEGEPGPTMDGLKRKEAERHLGLWCNPHQASNSSPMVCKLSKREGERERMCSAKMSKCP